MQCDALTIYWQIQYMVMSQLYRKRKRPHVLLLSPDAELLRTYVPRPGPGEGLQYQPHHPEEVAGKKGGARGLRVVSLVGSS